MLAAPHPLNTKSYWSLAALDSIDKANYMLLKRHGYLQPFPHTAMQLNGCNTDILGGTHAFLPCGQAGFIVDTLKLHKKLDNRAVRANYIRCLTKDTYQIFRRDKMKVSTIRMSEFIITPKGKQQERSANDSTSAPKRCQQSAGPHDKHSVDKSKELASCTPKTNTEDHIRKPQPTERKRQTNTSQKSRRG